MRAIYSALALSAFAVAAFAAARISGGRWRRRIVRYVPVGLMSRRYVVWQPIPRRQKDPVPVVLAFHGGGRTLEQMETQAGLHETRSAVDFAIVYPEGYHKSWNAGRCCGDALQSSIDDIRFVRRILDDLESIIKIDRRRIYATGFANGAMLCYYLACNMSEEIAAIAPVGGGMFVAGCTPRRPVGIFHLHGGADEWSPYAGGEGLAPQLLPPVADGIAFWRGVNGLDAEARSSMFRGYGNCTVYSAGPKDAQIRICIIPGLGHYWPGGGPTAATPAAARSADVATSRPTGPPLDRNDVNEAILGFFAGHALPERQVRRISLDLDGAG
jgi:polyhydroxybutyrate depolymerase